jgi:glucose-6-phosphate 1-epimerase
VPSLTDVAGAFAIPGALAFDEPVTGFIRALVTIPSCTAELYLRGAHLTRWEPSGTSPVLFLSQQAVYAPDHPIHGGIPIIFPWFGARSTAITGNRTDGPPHGFARNVKWALESTAVAGDSLLISLVLGPSDVSRGSGFGEFKARVDFSIGKVLLVKLTVINGAQDSLVYEEALHTYFSVSDVDNVRIEGLANADYLDKPDQFARKTQTVDAIEIRQEVDRVYVNSTATVGIVDIGAKRRIVIAKTGSDTTVVWNPYAEIEDVDPNGWRTFVCVESGNAHGNRLTLSPGAEHVLMATVSVEPLDKGHA